MKEIIISGEDDWIDTMKLQLEAHYPQTRGRIWIKPYQPNKTKGKPMGLKAGFKQSFKNMGDATKKALSPIDEVMAKIEKDIKF